MGDTLRTSIRVAVLEDEPALRDRIVVPGLIRYGFDAVGYGTVEAFLAGVASHPVDLLVLDVGLPDGDGFSVARQLRLQLPHVGIIMLTSRADVVDRIRGLSEGADAFFSKPIELDLLSAALHSLARRLSVPVRGVNRDNSEQWSLAEDGWSLLAPNGTAAALTASERSICGRLFAAAKVLVSREQLCDALADRSEDFDDHRLDSMIHRLRSKVRKRCGLDLPLTSVHGRGYCLDPRGRRADASDR
ncbi:response regulator transcription factor [Stenotrophomonas sp. NPDC077659]|uniref:response regulator transcription factor n=1 Tax=Stenotrophomonas sp. NPDC077659 TaxID=3390694 RepID=UPI003CFF4550